MFRSWAPARQAGRQQKNVQARRARWICDMIMHEKWNDLGNNNNDNKRRKFLFIRPFYAMNSLQMKSTTFYAFLFRYDIRKIFRAHVLESNLFLGENKWRLKKHARLVHVQIEELILQMLTTTTTAVMEKNVGWLQRNCRLFVQHKTTSFPLLLFFCAHHISDLKNKNHLSF